MIIEKEKKEQDKQKNFTRRAVAIWLRNVNELNDRKYEKYYDLVRSKIRKEKEIDDLIKEYNKEDDVAYEISLNISLGKYKYKTANMNKWRSIIILAISKDRSFSIVFDEYMRSFYRLHFTRNIMIKKRKGLEEKDKKKKKVLNREKRKIELTNKKNFIFKKTNK